MSIHFFHFFLNNYFISIDPDETNVEVLFCSDFCFNVQNALFWESNIIPTR